MENFQKLITTAGNAPDTFKFTMWTPHGSSSSWNIDYHLTDSDGDAITGQIYKPTFDECVDETLRRVEKFLNKGASFGPLRITSEADKDV